MDDSSFISFSVAVAGGVLSSFIYDVVKTAISKTTTEAITNARKRAYRIFLWISAAVAGGGVAVMTGNLDAFYINGQPVTLIVAVAFITGAIAYLVVRRRTFRSVPQQSQSQSQSGGSQSQSQSQRQ